MSSDSQPSDGSPVSSTGAVHASDAPQDDTKSPSRHLRREFTTSKLLSALPVESDDQLVSSTNAVVRNTFQDTTGAAALVTSQNTTGISDPQKETLLGNSVANSPDDTPGGKKPTPRTLGRSRTVPYITSKPEPRQHVPPQKSASMSQVGQKLYTYKDYAPVPIVKYVTTVEEANELVERLEGPLGFDLEWPVTFHQSGVTEFPTALVQFCDSNTILLIHVSRMKVFPEKVKEVIENPRVTKLGAMIRGDGKKLYRDFGILARGLVELGAFAGQMDRAFATAYPRGIVALARIVDFYLKKELRKGDVRTSDWSRPLSPEQIQYAADDSHCALMAYESILSVNKGLVETLDAGSFTRDLAQEVVEPPGAVTRSQKTSLGASSAYDLWSQGYGLLGICIKLGCDKTPGNDAEKEIVQNIVRTIVRDPRLPFDMVKLRRLVDTQPGMTAAYDSLGLMERQGRGKN
ncbi:ribonuclease H-like protein [Auriscalpium vulgare]|uniref:Ribonuclease H-like protein n=1 Tax=Auriscalpium vulgare TaxID=40419 RepID=A0ACB8S8A5_9AGAM|nr:ribonuclease H-like protein [Auriscalpium vulgare]